MAWTFVQGSTTPNVGAVSSTAIWPSTTASGNLLIAIGALTTNSAAYPVCTCSDGINAWTQVAGTVIYNTASGGVNLAMFYAVNASNNKGTVSTTFSGGTGISGAGGGVGIYEFSGLAASSPFDGFGTQIASSSQTPGTTSTITVSQAGELGIAAILEYGDPGQTWTPMSGFTFRGSADTTTFLVETGTVNSSGPITIAANQAHGYSFLGASFKLPTTASTAVQSTANTAASGASIAFASQPTIGNSVLIFVETNESAFSTTLTTGFGAVPVAMGSVDNSANQHYQRIWAYLVPVTASTNKNMTVTTNGSSYFLWAQEVSGAMTGITTPNSGNGVTATSGNLTVAANQRAYCAAIPWGTISGVGNTGTGTFADWNTNPWNWANGIDCQYAAITAGPTATFTWTQSSAAWSALSVVLSQVTSASPAIRKSGLLGLGLLGAGILGNLDGYPISIGTANAIASSEAFNSPNISTIQPGTGIATGETWNSPQISTLQPNSIVSLETVNSPQINTIQPNSIVSAETFSSPQINTLQPTSFAGGGNYSDGTYGDGAYQDAFGAPNISQPIQPTSIVSAETWSSPQISTLVLNTSIFDETFSSPQISTISIATGIASLESVSSVYINTIQIASGISTGETFDSPQISTIEITSSIASGETWSSPQINTVQPSSIASAEAFGSPSLPALVGQITSITSAETVSSPQINTLQPNSIVSAETFSSPQISTIMTSSITSSEAFGNPSLPALVGQITSITSAEAFSSVTISTLQPNSIASLEAWSSPQINTIQPSAIASAEAFGSPSLVFVISVNSVTSAEIFDSPQISILQPSAITSSEAWSSPQINTIEVNGISSGEAFGSPTLIRTIAVNSINSSEAFNNPQINTLQANSITTSETFNSPQINTIQPSTITSAELVDLPTISSGLIINFSPTNGIVSAEAFSSPVISTLMVNSIASSEAFGSPSLPVIRPDSITSSETWGSPQINNIMGPVSIFDEVIGSPYINTIQLIGIATEETWGSPQINIISSPISIFEELCNPPQINTLIPDSISSVEYVSYVTNIYFAADYIVPRSILSLETFGVPFLSHGGKFPHIYDVAVGSTAIPVGRPLNPGIIYI